MIVIVLGQGLMIVFLQDHLFHNICSKQIHVFMDLVSRNLLRIYDFQL